jgi:Coenzyme PQQ synthesis protein D (PqqD)
LSALAGELPADTARPPSPATTMLPSTARYLPAASVECTRLHGATVLTAPGTGESLSLSATGEAVWTLLQTERRTVDRLVMALARRSSGQALAQVPDLVHAELESFVRRGFVERVTAEA